jgi:hypothetical protein
VERRGWGLSLHQFTSCMSIIPFLPSKPQFFINKMDTVVYTLWRKYAQYSFCAWWVEGAQKIGVYLLICLLVCLLLIIQLCLSSFSL